MFRFGDLNRVIWPVRIGDAEFRAVLEIYDRKTLREREKRAALSLARRLAEDGGPRTEEDTAALLEDLHAREDADVADLMARVKDWFDVEDPDGKPLPFSTERLEALLATDYGFRAFSVALLEASRAGPAKNSQPGPGGMPARDQA